MARFWRENWPNPKRGYGSGHEGTREPDQGLLKKLGQTFMFQTFHFLHGVRVSGLARAGTVTSVHHAITLDARTHALVDRRDQLHAEQSPRMRQ
jgi:hypothetical protein